VSESRRLLSVVVRRGRGGLTVEFVNDIFEEFALILVGQIQGEGEIAFPDKLDRTALDFSLPSLKVLDTYLDVLHRRHRRIKHNEGGITLLRAGAYLGEVIRRNAQREYNWVDYDEYMPRHPKLKQLIPERNAATCAFLCSEDGAMTMPLNKIGRYIEEGPENNTHYYASVECRQE
jgi:hypothetical protein